MMSELRNDPVINTIYEGIVDPIKMLVEQEHFRAALLLTFCGIDAMTYLSLPNEKEDSGRKDFSAWCDKYIKLKNTQDRVDGLEFYAARSALVHNYKAESKLSDQGKVRILLFFTGQGPDSIYTPQESKEHIMVRIEGLIECFIEGVNEFVVDLFKYHKERTERRLEKMLKQMDK